MRVIILPIEDFKYLCVCQGGNMSTISRNRNRYRAVHPHPLRTYSGWVVES